jgi:integrase
VKSAIHFWFGRSAANCRSRRFSGTFATWRSPSSSGRRRRRGPARKAYRRISRSEVLARIPKRSPIILTNIRRQPWKPNGFGTAFNRAKIAAGMDQRDLHFHDLRGTAATRFYNAGLSEPVIAEIMAWDEEHVSRIIRRYVGRSAATKAVIRQLNQAEKGT